MIIKIKKRNLLLLLIIVLVTAPLAYAVASVKVVNFKIELAISNRNPTILLNNVTVSIDSSQFSVDPSAAGTTYVVISFNVTDADGVTQVNASKTVINFT